jgi:hypothetical protein
MSKRVTTRGYIAAWIVWVVAAALFLSTAHVQLSSTGASALGSSSISGLAWVVAGIAGIVMLMTWIGALIRLAQLHAWGWFVAVLVFQFVALGIIPMVAYAIAGPEDEGAVTRPSVT